MYTIPHVKLNVYYRVYNMSKRIHTVCHMWPPGEFLEPTSNNIVASIVPRGFEKLTCSGNQPFKTSLSPHAAAIVKKYNKSKKRHYSVMNSNNNQTRQTHKFTSQIPNCWCPGLPSLQEASILHPATVPSDRVIMARPATSADRASEMELRMSKNENPLLCNRNRWVTWEGEVSTRDVPKETYKGLACAV